MTKEALTPITWPTVKWLKPEQEPMAHSVVEPLRPDEYQRRVSVKWVGQPVAGALYTTPPHSFFEDVANELRVEIAELQDHIRLLEKQLAQPEQEPVAWMDEEINCAYTLEELDGGTAEGLIPLYTSPPQRTWVDLTDEQMWNAYTGGSDIINLSYAKSILELFKEKNT